MFRNLFALFSTFMLGTGAASASTADSTKSALEQRIQAAQRTIETLIGVEGEQDSKVGSEKLVWHNWANFGVGQPVWNNWLNGWRNWGNLTQAAKGTAPSGATKPPTIANPRSKSHK